MYPAAESKAKVVYKDPLFVTDDYFFKPFLLEEDNIKSECIHTVAATHGCKLLQTVRIRSK